MGNLDINKIRQKISEERRLLADKTKKRPKLFMGIAVLAAIILVTIFVVSTREKVKWSNLIKVSGIIEGDDVRISFRVHGKIDELLFDEGDLIKKDQVVARLVKDELTQSKNESAAALKQAEYQLELDALDYQRAQRLFEQGAISEQSRDEAKTKSETNKANVEQLRSALDLAEIKLGWADLASPLDGYIITKSSLKGEVVQSGTPVFTAIDLNDIWVTGYINETDLGKVKLNQKAYIMADTYPHKKYDGWVSFISQQSEFTPKYIQTQEERVKYVYRVKVRVDNSSLELKPGMPADAYIILNSE
ncbi:MAG: hypothetical protein A2Z72_03260 [Omnitrophica bacterium RBG_13_46_9]|nr:MAG: hypothetical protein A2Z72_03260 [Omnitrophica bacterium RBG_13_46_9]